MKTCSGLSMASHRDRRWYVRSLTCETSMFQFVELGTKHEIGNCEQVPFQKMFITCRLHKLE